MFAGVFSSARVIVKFHDNEPSGSVIDQIQQARETLEKLLSLLQSAPVERDRFVSHLYQSRREYRRACETLASQASKSSGASSRAFQIPESMGFKGHYSLIEQSREGSL